MAEQQLKRLRVGKREAKKALVRARLANVKTNEQLTYLEALVESVGELHPEDKERFLKELFEDKERQLDSYDSVKMEMTLVEKLPEHLPEMVKFYRDENPKGLSALKYLSKAGILSEEDVDNYLRTEKNIRKALGKERYLNSRSSFQSDMAVDVLSGTAIFFSGLFMSSITKEPEFVQLLLYVSSCWMIIGGYSIYNTFRGGYQGALKRHANKTCRTLPLDLENAVKYSKSLEEQLENPQNIDPKYKRRLDKIHQEQEKARTYLHAAVPLYELLKEEMDILLSEDSLLSLPKTL
ncbi:MAG: hypothetical protein Q8Q01_04330 [archaeon]|nr:hypothetical protein [archaeon]